MSENNEYRYWIMQDDEWVEVTKKGYERYSSVGMESMTVETIEIDPEYLNKDGTADLRKKRFPKEVQEEWQ